MNKTKLDTASKVISYLCIILASIVMIFNWGSFSHGEQVIILLLAAIINRIP